MGIRARVLLLAGAVALPLILLSGYRAHEAEQRALAQARHEALLLARVEAALLADRLNDVKGRLRRLAALADPCGSELKRLAPETSLRFDLSMVDVEGNFRCSVLPLPRSINVADRTYFRRALQTKAFAVSEPLTGRITGRRLLVSAQPVLGDDGAMRGLLLASIDTASLAPSLREARGMMNATVVLLDLDGTVLARQPHVPEYVGKPLPDLREHAKAAEGFIEYTGLDGVVRVAAYSRLREAHDWPLQVVVGIPRADIEQAPRAAFLREIAVLAIVLALALAVSFAGAQRLIVGPLRRLGAAAQRYDGGDLGARSGIDHAAGEMGALARSFDRLVEHNQRTTRALRALSAGNRTLLREKDEERLLAAMCRVAVEQAGYRVAFVNYAEQDEARTVRTVARAGDDHGFIDLLKLTWADAERGRGSVGTAIRSGKTSIIRSMASDDRFAPWREAAVARGLGSVASFPLPVQGAVIGTFTLIASEEDAFDTGELELLDEMAADLAFGIETIRAEARRKQAEAAARRALTHDALVDLPNRTTFIQMVMAAIADARRGGAAVAVLAVHVGRLQEIFDSFGYEAYRIVLKEIAARLATVPACHDASARLPMEEFGVLVPSRDLNVIGVIAERLLAVFEPPVAIGSVKLDVRAAVGVSFFPEHGDDGESLIRRASLVAREAFKKDVSFQVYRGASERENPERLALAAELRGAIDGDALRLHYQPKLRLADGGVVGYEALVRWFHPSRGAVSPATFIPVAEQMGMIRPMTNNIVRLAVRQLHDWAGAGRRLPVAVNLSARNLYDPLLVETVARWLKSYDVSGELLQFEITEGALVEEPESARETLNRLRAMGATIYIDDFGTGYSSLSYLATLPVNSLKIDRSFIRQMASAREAHSVVASIISMAHNLEMGVVAEGVETADQLEALKRLGCDEAQGYLFGKPVPAEAI